MTFRVIPGGRATEPTPGPARRRRGRGRDAGRRPADGQRPGRGRPPDRRRRRRPDRRHAPVVAAGRAGSSPPGRERMSSGCSRARATRSVGSPGSTRSAARSRPGSSTRTRTCCSPAAARTSSSCASAAPATWRSSRPAAASSRPSPRRAPRPPTTCRAHGRRWLDEMLGHGRPRSRRSPATASTSQTELRLLEVALELGQEGPIDVVPTFLGAHAVPPEFRDRPDGREAYVRIVIDEQLPGVAAQGRARFCDVFCEEGAFSAEQSERFLAAAAALGWRPGSTPTSSCRPAAPSWRPSSARFGRPPGDPVASRHRRARRRPPTAGRSWRRVLPATTWFLMKPRTRRRGRSSSGESRSRSGLLQGHA